jgi:hypothetical protein
LVGIGGPNEEALVRSDEGVIGEGREIEDQSPAEPGAEKGSG